MNVVWTASGLFGIYALFMFILSQIFIPDLGFKRPLQKLPFHVRLMMRRIGKKGTKHQVLDRVLKFQLRRFHSGMRKVFTHFSLLFENDVNKLWRKKGLIHCHQQSLILRHLLIATGRFKDEDIKYKITNCYANIHQSLKIRIGKKWIEIDPFAMSVGYKKGIILPRFSAKDLRSQGNMVGQ